eukprot:PhM_4_TR2027/c0_g1_i1/m.82583
MGVGPSNSRRNSRHQQQQQQQSPAVTPYRGAVPQYHHHQQQQQQQHYPPQPPQHYMYPGQYPAMPPQHNRNVKAPPQPPRAVTTSASSEKLFCSATVKGHSGKLTCEQGARDDRMTLSFVVDSTAPARCTVYVGVSVAIRNDAVVVSPLAYGVEPTAFDIPNGINQPQSVTLRNLGTVPPALLKYDATATPHNIPFVVMLQCTHPTGGAHTYYSLLRTENGTMETIRDMIHVPGKGVYQLDHVYGGEVVEGAVAGGEGVAGDETATCVVCLSEPTDTTVLPCRHMCMCSGCAEIIKRQNPQQCPICRTPIEQLLVARN